MRLYISLLTRLGEGTKACPAVRHFLCKVTDQLHNLGEAISSDANSDFTKFTFTVHQQLQICLCVNVPRYGCWCRFHVAPELLMARVAFQQVCHLVVKTTASWMAVNHHPASTSIYA